MWCLGPAPTFCALGRKLDTITQDSCAFHNDHVLYESFNGVVLVEEEGKNIAKTLGGAKAALLQNHGLLVRNPDFTVSICDRETRY